MTTILGIYAGKDKGIVLASDLQGSNVEELYKTYGRKLRVSKNRRFVIGMAGAFDKRWQDFQEGVLEGKIDIKEPIRTGRFPEFLELNIERCDGKVPENVNGMIIATNYGRDVKLYNCYPFGAVEPVNILPIGSGSKLAEEYLKSRNIVDYVEKGINSVDPQNLTLAQARTLAWNAVSHASNHDLGSGGFDMTQITSRGVREYWGSLRRINIAHSRAMSKLMSGKKVLRNNK